MDPIVSCGHPESCRAAITIMQKGGNAFDAAVGAGFASAVTEPALTSLGGGGFLLAHTADGDDILFDFFTDTPGRGQSNGDLIPHFFPLEVQFPGSAQIFNIGMGSVAVPGTLKGYLHIHQRHGTLPLFDVLSPAINLARNGVIFNHKQAYFMHILKGIMTQKREGKELYTVDGTYVREGTRIKNLDYADFLESLVDDRGDSFYKGKLAETICHDMVREDGLLNLRDLANYQVKERTPLSRTYRDVKLLTNPPPSFGGSLIAMALAIMEEIPFHSLQWGESEHLGYLLKIMQEVDNHRQTENCNFDSYTVDWCKTTGRKMSSRGTTHCSIRDSQGNVASMTTSNGEGSGYIVPGTGIMLNNMMGEDDLHPDGFHSAPAGERISSMMSPSIVLRDSVPVIILGSGGSKRIRTAITQIISNVVDFKMTIKEAIESPRIHWDGEILQCEPGFATNTIAMLKNISPTNIWPDHNMYFGGVHAIAGNKGAGDSRRGGSSMHLSLA